VASRTQRLSAARVRPFVAVEARSDFRGRVLVLGGGFLGAHVVGQLVQRGLRVDVVTRSEPPPELSSRLTGASVVLGDANSMSTLAGTIAEVDHVVYAVGSSSPSESDLDPASDIEIVLPPVVRLLELLRLRPSVGLTFLSSGGAVYGNTLEKLTSERDRPEPISSYGILKLTAEKYITMYSALYGVPVRILRIANAYGPGQPWVKGQGVIARLMRCALTGDAFQVFGDGSNVRDYIYIEDIASITADLIEGSDLNPVVNVGSGQGHSINELVALVEQVTHRRIEVQRREQRYFDVRSIVLDVSLLSSCIRYRPTSLETGLRQTWQVLRATEISDLPTVSLPHSPGAGW
jgi:UDP-glucose 4-epimerase